MDQVDAAAPAQPETPAVVTAVDQAVADRDLGAFREARQAERTGTPLEPKKPEAPKAEAKAEPVKPAEPAPEARELSKRQQKINDYERTIAEQRAEIARLSAGTPRTEPTKPAAPTVADHKRYLAMPDAPKEADFDNYDELQAARAVFIADKRYEERDAAKQATDRQTQAERFTAQRRTQFHERLAAASKADPTFDQAITDDVRALVPVDEIVRIGGTPSALNALATEFLENEQGPRLMRHFSEHPDDVTRFARLMPRDFVRELAKLELTFGSSAPAPTAEPEPENHVTKAPAPPTTLGGRVADTADPIESAVAGHDYPAYKAARMAERQRGVR